ncbi:MAG: 50S ribosomal protein L6 [archaeon]
MKQDLSREIKIEEKASVETDGIHVVATGPLGKVERDFPYPFLKIEKKDDMILLSTKQATKREKKIFGTICAHIKNMINGVINGYEYKLQVCSVHFPISVSVDLQKKQVMIKNFIGEARERKADIVGNSTLKVEGDIITISSPNIEAAAQTSANLEMATRIRLRDRRVFQDGIYLIERCGEKI